jgi:uncharacterized radical SAM protein YgiQ
MFSFASGIGYIHTANGAFEAMGIDFLPVSRSEMLERDWYYYDFLLVTGDAYVDHPSFGAAVIGRVLESAGYRVAILAQPQSVSEFSNMGKPRVAALITGGNIDSMVANYTAAKKRRTGDEYSPADGLRPDRATLVYSKMSREAFGDLPIVLGGLEASLRRFAHYDYWDDTVRRSYLIDADADILIYGMAECTILEVVERLKRKKPFNDVRGICYRSDAYPEGSIAVCESYEAIAADKYAYCRAFMTQYIEQDAATGRVVVQPHGNELVVQNPPAAPLTTAELDRFAKLPYVRTAHPGYREEIKAIEEVKFSIIHNRGCFGACSFCSIAFHQGRVVSARSHESVIDEAHKITRLPDFKGYIHDVGGPTANFRHPSCNKKGGMCKNRTCLTPEPCPNLNTDTADYLSLLRKLREIPVIKKIFVRSGLRYDFLMLDKRDSLLSELIKHHISGQLKVAPEHCAPNVLELMNKPQWNKFLEFENIYIELNKRFNKKQFIVPYLISSHPGCTLKDAANLAEALHRSGRHPEQVQDFYPTPGTLSTCMYYTGFDPRNMKPVYVPRTQKEKAMQRALLQWKRPDKRKLVIEALRQAGRGDLIGYGKGCLVRPLKSGHNTREVNKMAKDSQLDPKPVRKQKAKGGPTMAESKWDNGSNNTKKQSGNRHKPGDDKS